MRRNARGKPHSLPAPVRPISRSVPTPLAGHDAPGIVDPMAQVARPLVALFSLIALWFLAMVLEALRVPAWAIAMIGGVLLANLIVLTVSLYQATREPGDRHGDGGLPVPCQDLPEPGGGDEPSWWPELERDLQQYLAEHEQAARQPDRAPVGAI